MAAEAGGTSVVAYAAQELIKAEDPGSDHSRRRASSRWLQERPDFCARTLIIAVALILTWHTWARWGDIQIDCGKELYVPLEILKGKVLYRDIWYPYGPLTPYLEALLVKLAGQNLYAFYGFGIALAIACALLLYRIGAKLEGRAVGLVAALALLFRGFGPTQCSFPFPYTYAAPLGLLLSLVCASFTIDYLLNSIPRDLIFAGLAAGLTLICKLEYGVACWGMLAFAVGLEAVVERSIRTLLPGAIRCLPGLLMGLAVYWWLCWKLGTRLVLVENLPAMPGSYFLRTYGARYDSAVGLRFAPAETAFLVAIGAIALAAWFWIAKGSRLHRDRIGGGLFWTWVIILATAVAAARYFAASGNARYLLSAMLLVFPPGMYFIACAFIAYLLYRIFKTRARRPLAEATFAVFALGMAARVIAAVYTDFFSIFCAPPLVLAFIAALARCLYVASKGMSDERRCELINVLLAVEAGLLAIMFVPGAGTRNAAFETGWGTIYLTPNDAAVASRILDLFSEQKRLGRRVVVLPGLTTMYVLSGTEATNRWYMFVPGSLPPDQETNYVATLERAAPTYIIVGNENTNAYGVPYFGIDYNRKVYRWIENNYRIAGQFGNFRRQEGAPLAALVYQRRDSPASAGAAVR